MGSFFISWDMLTHCLVNTLLSCSRRSALMGLHTPKPQPARQYMSVTKRLNELGRLIDQVPNICTFQGLE